MTPEIQAVVRPLVEALSGILKELKEITLALKTANSLSEKAIYQQQEKQGPPDQN
jgi:hypothetical protein